MALGDNAIVPLYDPGAKITCACTAAITHGTFVKISGSFQGGPLLSTSTPITGGNLPQVVTCTAAAKAFGVAGWDTAASGDVLPVFNGPGIVVPMSAGGSITAGNEVESDASGNPVALASGKSLGMALNTVTSSQTVYIRLST